MGKMLKRNEFLNLSKINEEAPFSNEIAWGDSIIGRFINSFARKAKIAFNKRRISGLTNQLKSTFDEMISLSGVEISSDNLRFLKLSALLGELKSQVEKEEDVDILISTTSSLIDVIKPSKYKNKDVMVESLEDFLKFLRDLKKGNVDTSSKETSKEEESIEKTKVESILTYSKNFLQSIIDLESDIKNNVVKIEVGSEIANSHFDQEKFKSLLSKVENKNVKDKKFPLTGIILNSFKSMDLDKKRSIISELKKSISNGLSFAKGKNDKKGIELFYQYQNKYKNVSFEDPKPAESTKRNTQLRSNDEMNFDLSDNKERKPESVLRESNSNLKGFESHARNAWKKIVNAYKLSGISKYTEYISNLLDTKVSDGKDKLKESNDKIIQIVKQVVLNSSTSGKSISFDELIKEQYSTNDISKSISLFSRYILPLNEDQGLWASFGFASNHIKSFLTSFSEMKNRFKSDSEESKSEDSKEEKKNELFRFKSFKMINEKNEFSNQIQEKFDEVFTEEIQSYFSITEEKRAKMESEVKKSSEFVFTTADPIIEVVRVFNRAWRIHTPGVIPSGRTEGKVSNSTFREFEYLGGGSGGTADRPGSGPYRNIELFEQWNNAVTSILSDVKYRPIFSDDVKFNFTSSETGKSGDSIKKGGKILLRFINRLTSESQMYSDKGAMSRFIEEYFGLNKEQQKGYGFSYPETPNDFKQNQKTSSKISRTEVKFVKWTPNEKFFENDNKKSVIRFTTKKDDATDEWYMKYMFTDKEKKYMYVLFSMNALPYDLSKLKFDSSAPMNTASHVYFGKILVSDVLKKHNWLIKHIDIESDLQSEDIKSTEPFIVDLSILTSEKNTFYKGIGKLFGKSEYKRITEEFLLKNVDRLK